MSGGFQEQLEKVMIARIYVTYPIVVLTTNESPFASGKILMVEARSTVNERDIQKRDTCYGRIGAVEQRLDRVKSVLIEIKGFCEDPNLCQQIGFDIMHSGLDVDLRRMEQQLSKLRSDIKSRT